MLHFAEVMHLDGCHVDYILSAEFRFTPLGRLFYWVMDARSADSESLQDGGDVAVLRQALLGAKDRPAIALPAIAALVAPEHAVVLLDMKICRATLRARTE